MITRSPLKRSNKLKMDRKKANSKLMRDKILKRKKSKMKMRIKMT